MSIAAPTYTRRQTALLGRSYRVRAIIAAGLRREFRRPSAIFAIGAGTLLTTVSSIVLVLFRPFLLPGQPLDLSFFFTPAQSPAILFFATLMAATVGSGLIADDRHSMALTLYLSRPITHGDYVVAKAGILVPLLGMITVLPLAITPFAGALLGLFPWDIALLAVGLSIAIGFLLTMFYASLSLFFSSLTSRRAYAAAAIFATNFGLAIPAEVLSPVIEQPSLLYLSPWEDFLAVARAAFGAGPGPIDWVPALGILLGATLLAAVATYARMRAVEVVTG